MVGRILAGRNHLFLGKLRGVYFSTFENFSFSGQGDFQPSKLVKSDRKSINEAEKSFIAAYLKCYKDDMVEYLKEQQQINRDNADATLVAHRRPKSFWSVLLKQKVDFKRPFLVIWAGETSSDDGGPFREFLLWCMENFHLLNSYFFGERYKLFFTALTDAVIKKHYFVLGQLSALSILHIPKGVKRISGGWGTGYFKEPFPEKIIQSKEVVSSDFANFDIFCS